MNKETLRDNLSRLTVIEGQLRREIVKLQNKHGEVITQINRLMETHKDIFDDVLAIEKDEETIDKEE